MGHVERAMRVNDGGDEKKEGDGVKKGGTQGECERDRRREKEKSLKKEIEKIGKGMRMRNREERDRWR